MQEFRMAWGGSSKVYRSPEDKTIAIKEFYPNKEALFENEKAMLSEITHQRIIKLYNFSIDGGVCKLFLELGERDLLYRFFCENPLPCKPLVRMQYAIETAEALCYLHDINILHLDVNLRNIVLVSNGEHIKLIDFGLSIKLKPGQKEYICNKTMGSPGYEPPESEYGIYSSKSDIYSFGIVLGALRFNQQPKKDKPIEISEDCVGEDKVFIMSFWRKEPQERPDIKLATDRLQMEKFFAIK